MRSWFSSRRSAIAWLGGEMMVTEANGLLPFIDAHHHFYDLERGDYQDMLGSGNPKYTELFGDYSAIRRSYLIHDLLRDFEGSNVVKSVHAEAGWTGPDPVDETKLVQQVADEFGFPHGIVAFTDLSKPGAATELERHCAYRNMRGIGVYWQDELLGHAECERNLRVLGSLGLSCDLSATWEAMRTARKLAEAHPKIQFILGHTGWPRARTEQYFRDWREAMRVLAEAPNVAVKISGLGMGDHTWTPASIRPWILETIAIFGTNRCMFATNWPVDSLWSTFKFLVDTYRDTISTFAVEEQAKMLAGNAERLYRL